MYRFHAAKEEEESTSDSADNENDAALDESEQDDDLEDIPEGAVVGSKGENDHSDLTFFWTVYCYASRWNQSELK